MRRRTTDFDLNVVQLKPTAQMQWIRAGKREPSPQAAGSAVVSGFFLFVLRSFSPKKRAPSRGESKELVVCYSIVL